MTDFERRILRASGRDPDKTEAEQRAIQEAEATGNKTKVFIAKARKVHGDKYSYDKFVYVNNRTKGTMTCRLHGDWEAVPYSILSGRGCPSCGTLSQVKARSSNLEEFTAKAVKIHGDKYSFDKFVYVTVSTKGTITCKIHGDWEAVPNSILSGQGCPSCGTLSRVKAQSSNLEEFLAKAVKVHGDKYSYDKFVYVDSHTKGTATCRLHGDWEVTPSKILNGQGCPSCGELGRQDLITPTYLYYFRIKFPSYGARYKIGVTNQRHGIYDRYTKEEYVNFSNLKEWLLPDGKAAYELEQHFLAKYKSDRYYKKILSSGNTELFSSDVLTDEDIAHIESHTMKNTA